MDTTEAPCTASVATASRNEAVLAKVGEPGGAGPIGPYPPGVDSEDQQDEYDRVRRRVLWTLPSGLYVVGSRAGERRNGMTINWVS